MAQPLTPLSKLPNFDPERVPVIGVDHHLPAVPAERLSAHALRQRFAQPPAWQPEVVRERKFAQREPALASVLVGIVMRDTPTLLLTQRTAHLSTHSGQIAFPGGKVDPEDADAATLKSAVGQVMAWTPAPGTQLLADFDNGKSVNDALGQLASLSGLGLGSNEGLIAAGDSGGPAFINGQVAGVAGYVTSLSVGATHPDVDNISNSSYGEMAAWQRVSQYQQWIDQSLRAQYPHAPTKPADVQKAVPEGNSGTSYAYFLLQFTGVRSDPNQWLSVDYTTRDGTAQAGRDYIAARGKLVLYPNENQAVIPVEVIGDVTPEPDETFYLDVTNPVGGSFGPGVVMLTAMRTIVNDDGWI